MTTALILLFEEPIQVMFEWLTTTYQRLSNKALADAGLDDLAN